MTEQVDNWKAESSIIASIESYFELMTSIYQDVFTMVQNTFGESTKEIIGTLYPHVNDEGKSVMSRFEAIYKENKEIQAEADAVQKGLANNTAQQAQMEGLRKQMDVIADLDKNIQEQFAPLVMELQCEDILLQKMNHFRVLFSCLEEIYLKKGDENWDKISLKLMQHVVNNLTMADERPLLFEFFFDNKLNIEEDITPAFLEQIAKEMNPFTFTRHVNMFLSEILMQGAIITQEATMHITEIIDVLMEDAQKISSATSDSLKDVHNINEEIHSIYAEAGNEQQIVKDSNQKEKVQKLMKELGSVANRDSEIAMMMEPILTSLQLQDRIQQNLNNLSRNMTIWSMGLLPENVGAEDEIYNKEDGSFQPMGVQFFHACTMEEEREILRKYFDLEGVEEEEADAAEMECVFL